MSKSIRVFTLTLVSVFLFLFSTQLFAQLSEKDLAEEIRREMEMEMELMQKHQREAEIIAERIRELKDREGLKEVIGKLIEENDNQNLLQEFSKYAERLDNLIKTDPTQAAQLLLAVKGLFQNVFVVQDQIHYYEGAVLYYTTDDFKALEHLEPFFSRYPNSVVAPQAMAIALKALLGLGQETKAERDFLAKYPNITSPEIKYLAGHVMFNLGKDDEASNLFNLLNQDDKYGMDSMLMLHLISVINKSPEEAISHFKSLDAIATNNPFIVLALARMYIQNSEWTKAEEQYKRFYALHRDGRVTLTQYEIVLSLLNSGKKSEALTFLENLMQQKDAFDYYTTFLCLWAEIMVEDNKANLVQPKIDEFKRAIEASKTLLPRKISLLNQVRALKDQLYTNPSFEGYEVVSNEVLRLARELGSLHQELTASPNGLPLNSLMLLHNHELKIVEQYLTLFENYARTNSLRNIPDERSIAMISGYENFLDQYEKAIKQIQESLLSLEQADLRLQRQNDIDRNIDVVTQILDTIEELKVQRPDFVVDPQIVTKYQNELAELAEMRELYQYDNSLYVAIQEEVDDFYAYKEIIGDFFPYAKRIFTEVKPALAVDKQLVEIRAMIDDSHPVSDQYERVVNSLASNFDKSLTDLDLIGFQGEFLALMKRDRERTALSFEQSRLAQERLIVEMRSLTDRILSFININPNLVPLDQPMNLGRLFGKANLYYYLAELDFAINQRDIQPSTLDYYRLALNADPSFYMKDSVLYNIGYYSSYLLRNQIEDRKEEFWIANPRALIRPENLRETENYYSEAISAYTELLDSYPNSDYIDDALFRMGVLFFNIGSDADEPIRYYTIARERYFDRLIVDPTNPYYYEAMYQRGWTYLNSNEEQDLIKALSDFMTLLTAIEDGKIKDQYLVTDYTNAAVANIAYVLIAVDGSDYDEPAKGAAFIETRMKDFIDYKLIQNIIDEAIKMKRDLSANMHVTDFIITRMNLEPLSVENPKRLQEILQIYYANQRLLRNNADIRDLQYDTYLLAKRMFNNNTDWYKANKDKEISVQLAFINEAYAAIETRLNNRFFNDPTSESFTAYSMHLDDYVQFPKLIGDGFETWKSSRLQNMVDLNIRLAEQNKNPLTILAAIKRAYEYNDMYPENRNFFVNEALAYQMMEDIHDNYADTLFVLATENESLPSNPATLFVRYKDAAQRYANVLTAENFKSPANTETYIALMIRVADIEFDRRDFASASQTYQKILLIEDELSGPVRRDAYWKLAQISDTMQDRSSAEAWYRKAQVYALNAEDRQNFVLLAQEQIVKGIEDAKTNNDHIKVANEYLRLAEEYKGVDNDRFNGFKLNAAESFKFGQDYTASIDLIIEVASDFKNVEDVFMLYNDAWVIADSLKTDKALAESLKHQFIAKYPASQQSYALRIEQIKNLKTQSGQKEQVNELYIALHSDVKAKKIDSGTDKSEDIFLEYIQYNTDNEPKMIQLMEQFTTLYPQNDRKLDFMSAMALSALAKGDTLRYDQLAKDIYRQDKTRNEFYLSVAERQLKAILDDFNRLYDNKEWQRAFAKRDEFKRVEAAYIKEGLSFNTAGTYEEFTRIEKEYKDIQDRIAFLRSYDAQLSTLERGFLTKKPGELLRVTAATTWMGHLAGGEKRVEALKKLADAEAAKVYKVLDGATGKGLDNTRIARTHNLVTRIYEHAANALRTQIDFFINNSNQIRNERTSHDYQNTLDLLNNQKENYAFMFIEGAYNAHLDIYDLIYMAGHNDKYTAETLAKLTELNAMPAYHIDEYKLDGSWQMLLKNIDDSTTRPVGQLGQAKSPQGVNLSTLTIPPKNTLTLKKIVRSRVIPLYGYAQMVYPYDAKIKINSQELAPSYQPVDTLETGKPLSTRYAVLINSELFQVGENTIEFEFPNTTVDPLNFGFAMNLISSRLALEQAVPLETISIVTDNKWKAQVADSTGTLVYVPVSIAANFGISNLEIVDLEESTAKPIWVGETDENPVNEVVFETEFTIDTQFRSGSIICAAPEYVTLILNGEELEKDYMFDYDEDPLLVYPMTYNFGADKIKQGKNTLKLVVRNESSYRGIIADITIVKTGKEGGI